MPDDIVREWDLEGEPGQERIFCPDGDYPCCFDAEFLVQHANPRLPSYHDKYLVEATKEINGIFDKVREANPGKGHLSIIVINNGLLLVWADHGEGVRDVLPKSKRQKVSEKLGLGVKITKTVKS